MARQMLLCDICVKMFQEKQNVLSNFPPDEMSWVFGHHMTGLSLQSSASSCFLCRGLWSLFSIEEQKIVLDSRGDGYVSICNIQPNYSLASSFFFALEVGDKGGIKDEIFKISKDKQRVRLAFILQPTAGEQFLLDDIAANLAQISVKTDKI